MVITFGILITVIEYLNTRSLVDNVHTSLFSEKIQGLPLSNVTSQGSDHINFVNHINHIDHINFVKLITPVTAEIYLCAHVFITVL